MKIHNRVAVATSVNESEALRRLKYNAIGESWLDGLHDVPDIMSTKDVVFMAYAASHMPIVRFHPYYDEDGSRRLTIYVEDEEGNMFTPATPSNLETLYYAALLQGRLGKAARMRKIAKRRRLSNIPELAENNISVRVIFEGGHEYTYDFDVVRGTYDITRE